MVYLLSSRGYNLRFGDGIIMNEITITVVQFKELQRLMSEIGNSPLVCKGEVECYDDNTKAKWDTDGVILWLTAAE